MTDFYHIRESSDPARRGGPAAPLPLVEAAHHLGDAAAVAADLEACRESDEPLLYPLVYLALSNGARQGELLGLRRPVIDWQCGRVASGPPASRPRPGQAPRICCG